MKNIVFLFVFFACCSVLNAESATNEIWKQKISWKQTGSSGFIPLREIYMILEKESQQNDPEGAGVRIVYMPSPFLSEPMQLPVETFAELARSVSIGDMMELLADIDGAKCIVYDRVAIVGQVESDVLLKVFYGECLDADTKEPIRDFKIMSSDGESICSLVSSNGQFMCAVPVRVKYIANANRDVYFSRENYSYKPNENIKAGFRVVADGYEEISYIHQAVGRELSEATKRIVMLRRRIKGAGIKAAGNRVSPSQ